MRNYLYGNLLCNEIIIKQIFSDFENNDKQGFIFPDDFISRIQNTSDFKTEIWINIYKIIDISFANLNIRSDNIMNFPSSNMFWPKNKTIHLIANKKIIKLSHKESDQIDGIILNAFENISFILLIWIDFIITPFFILF